jgi:nucleoside-diphosphate-sugar epimerase
MRVMITGAGGFVGRHLSQALAQSGATVLGVGRRPPPADTGCGEWLQVGSYTEWERLRPAMQRVDAVVHLAARVHVMRETSATPQSAYREANEELVRHFASEARARGVRRFVLASSVKAVGERSDTPWTEATPPAPEDDYGKSKLGAERALAGLADGRVFSTVALRLPLVYGPGVGANMLRLVRAVDQGMPFPLGLVHNRRRLAFVGNVCSAMEAALLQDISGHRTYFVGDSEALSTADLVRRIGRLLGRKVWLLPIPPAALKGAAGLAYGLARLERRLAGVGGAIQRLIESLDFDIANARSDLGWDPPFTVDAGLESLVQWYRTQVLSSAR